MSHPQPIPSAWSRGRFLLVAALLFAAQAGWVLLLGERPRPPAAPAVSRTVFRLLDKPLDDATWTKHFFAGDPAVFPSSSPHGFAGQAWPRRQAKDDTASLEKPSPSFLEFAARRSGPNLQPPGLASLQTPFQVTGWPDPSPDSVPDFPADEASRPESFLRIEGELAARRLGRTLVLSSWPSKVLVTNSVVRFAVNRAGQVISAVLLAGSGLKEADLSAVATVNGLRFRPLTTGAPERTWDTAVFYWKTIAPEAIP